MQHSETTTWIWMDNVLNRLVFLSLKENDARRLRAIKKAEVERAQIRLKELEIQKLKAENDTLLARKELLEDRVRKGMCYQEFMERATKMSGKVVALLVGSLLLLQYVWKGNRDGLFLQIWMGGSGKPYTETVKKMLIETLQCSIHQLWEWKCQLTVYARFLSMIWAEVAQFLITLWSNWPITNIKITHSCCTCMTWTSCQKGIKYMGAKWTDLLALKG